MQKTKYVDSIIRVYKHPQVIKIMKEPATKAISLITIAMLIFGLVGMVAPFKTTTAAPLADGLVAYWNLDDGSGSNANEPVSGYNGTLNNDATWGSSAPVIGSTYSASFDGDGDFVEVADTADLDIEEELTISFWFQLAGNSGDNDWPRAVSKGQSTVTDGAYGVFIKDTTDPDDIGLRFIDQSNVSHDVRNTALTDYSSGWHHVVATYSNSGDVGKLYLDGSEVQSVAIAGDVKIRTNNADLTIGSAKGDAERDFNGDIDEVRIYNRALSSTEVDRLYDYGTFTLDVTPDTSTNPIGTDHEVTITLDTPLSYIPVLYSVSGNTAPGEDTQYIYTDENGQIVFSYTGVNLGTDNIIACIDVSWFVTGGGVCDAPFDEPSDTATKDWIGYEISGIKYKDTNADGIMNGDDYGLADWTIELWDGVGTTSITTYANGSYSFMNLLPGTYTVCEVQQSPYWVQTEPFDPYCYEVEITDYDVTDMNFGNVHLIPTDGRTIGFWGNKNGCELLDSGDFTMLSALKLVKQDGGDFNPTGCADLRNWLRKANAKNMAYMLSAQLAATALAEDSNFLDVDTLVYAPELLPFGESGEPLEGIINAFGFITIGDLITAADDELLVDTTVYEGDDEWAYQMVLKNVLNKINSKYAIEVDTDP